VKRSLNKYQKLINKFSKEPESVWAHPTVVRREIKIAKKLFALKSQKFWEEAHLPFKLNSLAWFLGRDGAEYIEKQEILLTTATKEIEVHELKEEKIGEDREVAFKPNTLMEFLDGKRK